VLVSWCVILGRKAWNYRYKFFLPRLRSCSCTQLASCFAFSKYPPNAASIHHLHSFTVQVFLYLFLERKIVFFFWSISEQKGRIVFFFWYRFLCISSNGFLNGFFKRFWRKNSIGFPIGLLCRKVVFIKKINRSSCARGRL
jgi:hypothetical protein